jgi:hypothetical protein
MFTALSTLDTPLGPRLVRPFYIAGSALALLLAGIGLLAGVATMTSSVLLGLFVLGLGGLLGATVFLGVRLTAEAVTIVFAQGSRPAGSAVSRTV